MKLLILTQKVDKNDDVLGFFHGWILEFAKNYEKVTVICLYEGKHDLPENVKVLSLGKERGVSKLKYILNFYKAELTPEAHPNTNPWYRIVLLQANQIPRVCINILNEMIAYV